MTADNPSQSPKDAAACEDAKPLLGAKEEQTLSTPRAHGEELLAHGGAGGLRAFMTTLNKHISHLLK